VGVPVRSGTVTFVFTDIQGSTRLARELRERWPNVRAEHRGLIRDAFAAHGGEEVDTQGDSFFYVFSRARDAALAAADAQRALAAHDWPDDGEVQIRIGMHTAEPVVSDEGYHGIGVHRAARIMAAGHGGQILLSEATAAVLADEKPPGIELRDLGRHQLKDLDRPERVFQLMGDGLRQLFPRVRTARPPRPIYRRPLVVGAAAGVLAAAVAIPVFALAGGSDGGGGLTRVDDNAVGVVDDKTGAIIDQAPDIAAPTGVAAGEGAIWVTSSDGGGSVLRLDPVSHDVKQTFHVGSGPTGIAVGAGDVWVASSLAGTVSRIDPETNSVVQTIPVGNSPTAVAFGEGAVWVANRDDRTISELDPATGKVRDAIRVDAAPSGLAIGTHTVWVRDAVGNAVARVDTRSHSTLSPISVGSGPGAIAYGGGEVWVANNLDGTVSRIDASRGIVTDTVPVGAAPNGITIAPDSVWVTDEVAGTLVGVDRKSLEVSRKPLGGRPEGVTVADGALWVAVQASGAAHHGGTLRGLAAPWLVDSVDPAKAYSAWWLTSVTGDGLVGFKRVGGTEGNSLVPDLATALPTPTDDGRTYSFQLRTGIRFSNGHLLKPSDVRYTMERVFEAGTAAPGFYEMLVGGPQCKAHPKRCNLSAGVVGDDTQGTVTFHLREPDGDFLYKLALPFAFVVPAGTPWTGDHPVPGTGPYHVSEYKPGRRVRLVRNTEFRTWSSAARPDGVVDEIVVRLRNGADTRMKAVLAGRADFFSGFPPNRLDEARTRYAGQLHITPQASMLFVTLSTKRPPFDNVYARRAVAYAFDRGRLVQEQGGPDLAAPTCQALPPNFPGYRRYCPFTVEPNRGGSWTAPDVSRGRALVARSGTNGARVEIIGLSPGHGAFTSLTNELERTLRKLGYRVSVRRLPTPEAFFAAYGPGARSSNAMVDGWNWDYPGPANLMDGWFSCKDNPWSCNPALDQKVHRALVLQAHDPRRADEVWARLDREAVDQAASVLVMNPKAIDFVSKRLGNYERHPVYGILLDQVWVQ
jgi:YVTN family beta-propeller protein